MIRANVKSVESAKRPAKGHVEETIGGHRGLVLRIYASGERVFYFRYRLNGRLTRMRLGSYPAEISLEAAMAKRAELKMQLRAGTDPGANVTQARRARILAPTVADFADTYVERYAKASKRSWQADARMLAKDVLPTWGRMKVADITRADVRHLVDEIEARGAARQAGKVLAVVRGMLAYAVQREVIKINPATEIKPPKTAGPRDRVLSDAEIADLWRNIDGAPLRAAVRDAIKLQLLTGARIGEVLGICGAEIDFTAQTWVIPAARSKNKREHLLPLTAPALEILRPFAGIEGLLWPTRGRKGPAPIRTEVAAHELAECVHQLVQGKPFTTHDLRRTVETRLAALGVAKETRDRVLNHADGSVGGKHYNRHDYIGEKRAALDRWARELQRIASGEPIASNVTPIRSAGSGAG